MEKKDLQSGDNECVPERVMLDEDHDDDVVIDDDLQSSDNECVPERVKLGAAIVQHSCQPGVQSLQSLIRDLTHSPSMLSMAV